MHRRCHNGSVNSYVERIAEEWRERAEELAAWTMSHLVNRTDVWGRYLAKKYRTDSQGVKNNAITAPFSDERGKGSFELLLSSPLGVSGIIRGVDQASPEWSIRGNLHTGRTLRPAVRPLPRL